MKILQLPQGHYGDLTGMPELEAIAQFVVDDLTFLERNPQCAKYHRQLWRELDVKDTATAPWGYEWYVTDEDGRLQFHSADYDSSG
jgi:hypothetical protein